MLECFFFFNDTATTEIYTLSLHDALPICGWNLGAGAQTSQGPLSFALSTRYSAKTWDDAWILDLRDRKSTRLNSSHSQISYAVFCLKKKKKTSKTLLSAVRVDGETHVAAV